MSSILRMSLSELVAHIQSSLREDGIETVLSGGSCVTIWSLNAYRSDDIDLIAQGYAPRAKIRAVMLRLGFVELNRYFTHSDTKFLVEFPAGPPNVGEEYPKKFTDVNVVTGVMRLLTPTDCVKDRLVGWFHNNDRQCLNQAIAVARKARVNLAELGRWAKGEHKSEEFKKIAAKLKLQNR
jgi:hypothetical protein